MHQNLRRTKCKDSQEVESWIPLTGAVYKYDLSLPLDQMYQLVEEMRCRLASESVVVVRRCIAPLSILQSVYLPPSNPSLCCLGASYL
jgi:hypothetical protein